MKQLHLVSQCFAIKNKWQKETSAESSRGLLIMLLFFPFPGHFLKVPPWMFVGQMTDRYGRRRIVFLSLTIEGLTAGFLLKGSINGWLG